MADDLGERTGAGVYLGRICFDIDRDLLGPDLQTCVERQGLVGQKYDPDLLELLKPLGCDIQPVVGWRDGRKDIESIRVRLDRDAFAGRQPSQNDTCRWDGAACRINNRS